MLDNVHIERLVLTENKISDGGIIDLMSSRNAKQFKEFCFEDQFHGCGKYARRGREAIMNFLRREDTTAIEIFGVDYKDSKHAKILIELIPKKSKMLELLGTIGTSSKQSISIIAPSVLKLLCNTSSLDTLVESNHLPREIGNHTETYTQDCYVGNVLKINRRSLHGVSAT